MRRCFAGSAFLAVFLNFGLAQAAPSADCAPPPGRLVYDVTNDEDKVGEAVIVVDREGEETAVRTKMAAVITVLTVPIYRYSHQSTEIWRDGDFHSVKGWTLDAGRRYDVTIAPGDRRRYRVNRNGDDSEVNGTLLSQMVWCRESFQGGEIVSTMTGRARPIPVDDLGIETRSPEDGEDSAIPVGPSGSHYYRFTRKGRVGYVWYGNDGIVSKVAYPTRYGTMAGFSRRQ
jgi:hypothetical protein